MDSMHFFLGFLISLFVIADPFGMVPVFLSLSEGAEQKWCNKQARKCAINVFVLMDDLFSCGFLGARVLRIHRACRRVGWRFDCGEYRVVVHESKADLVRERAQRMSRT